MNNKVLNNGIAHAILSAIIFGLMPLFTQLLYKMGANSVSSAFYRMVPATIVLYFFIKFKEKKDLKINKYEAKGLCLAALGFSLTSITLFSSYEYINSGAATTIHFAYPIVIFIAVNFIKKYRPKATEVICVVFVAVGIILIMNMDSSNELNLKGVFFAVLSALTYSFYSIYLEMKNLIKIGPTKLLFYLNLFSVIVVIIYSLITKTEIYLGFKGVEWILPIIYSFIITFGAAFLYQSAIVKIGADKTSILSTLEPITSLIVGIVVLKEEIVLAQIIGVVLILVATTKLVNRK